MFSFGSSTTTTTTTAPSFSFGQTPQPTTTTTAAPSFSFGQTLQQPTATTTATVTATATPTPTFGFGQTPQQPAASTAPTTFGFGQTAQQPAATPTFGFGQTPQQPAATPTFGFGQTPQQPAVSATPTTFSFGQQPAANAPTTTMGFGFGQTAQTPQPAASTVPSTFGFLQTPQTAATFGFGQTQPQQQQQTANTFGFGQTMQAAAAPANPFAIAMAQPQQPAMGMNTFGFGQVQQQQPNAGANPFGFGQNQPQQQQPATAAFGFGQTQQPATTAATSFGFGQTTQPVATSGFSFGQNQPAATAQGFGFTQQNQPAKIGFGFNQTNAAAPVTTGFGFNQTQPAGQSSFSGMGNTTGSTGFGANIGTKKCTTRGVKPTKVSHEGSFLNSITGLTQFNSFSFEELRFMDMFGDQAGASGQAPLPFGTTPATPATPTLGFGASSFMNPQATTTPSSPFGTTNMFASTTAGSSFGTQNTVAPFGTTAPATTTSNPFAAPGTGTNNAFGSTGNTAFSQQGGFSMAAKPAATGTTSGLFQTATTGFALGNATTPTLTQQAGAGSTFTSFGQNASTFSTPNAGFSLTTGTQSSFPTMGSSSFTFAQPQSNVQGNTAANAEPQTYIKTIGSEGLDSYSYSSQNFRKIYGKKTTSTPKKTPQSSPSPSPASKTYTLPFTQTRKDYADDLPSLGLVNTRPDYITTPFPEELEKMYNEEGKFVVDCFRIEREGIGSVEFLQPVDVRNINIDKVVLIETREITINHSEEKYGGYKLNIPARVQLKGAIQGKEASKAALQAAHDWCNATDAKFISLSKETGFVFEVKHFSKYTFPVFDADSDQQESTAQASAPENDDSSQMHTFAHHPGAFNAYALQTPHVQHRLQQKRPPVHEPWMGAHQTDPAATHES